MIALDTGICVPESRKTLEIQQQQLKRGLRAAQMFPTGTAELQIPDGCKRYENERGVYHFWHDLISLEELRKLSCQGRENEFLNLGPFSKYDIAKRCLQGEVIIYITEYLGDTEVRSAVGTNNTIEKQKKYFEYTKEPCGVIVVGPPPARVRQLYG